MNLRLPWTGLGFSVHFVPVFHTVYSYTLSTMAGNFISCVTIKNLPDGYNNNINYRALMHAMKSINFHSQVALSSTLLNQLS